MPPKDMQQHEFFLSNDNGETYKPLGKAMNKNIIVDDLIPEEGTKLPFIKPDEELVISCKFNIRSNPSLYIFLLTGKWPSNNWLRLHGYQMVRRCGYRKRK
jgi:hypothetical protein